MEVPVPAMESWMRLEWGPTKASIILWCDVCKVGEVCYATVFRARPEALLELAEAHQGCAEKAKAPSC